MARPKGSLNKKVKPVQLDFEEKLIDKPNIDEKTEVCMANVYDEAIEEVQKELDLARVELEKTKLEIETKKHELKVLGDVPAVVKPAETPAIAIKDTALAEKIATQKAYDNVMVTGKFYNLRVKGQSVKLPYHKYPDDPVKWWPLDHGKVYTIPRGFADQLNGGTETDPCHYTPHFIKNEGIILNPDDPESGIHAVDTTDKKFSFVPLNF